MDTFEAKHFSLSLPRGDGQDKVAELLRHLANRLEELDNPYVLDIILHNEIEDGKEWPSFTVYFSED